MTVAVTIRPESLTVVTVLPSHRREGTEKLLRRRGRGGRGRRERRRASLVPTSRELLVSHNPTTSGNVKAPERATWKRRAPSSADLPSPTIAGGLRWVTKSPVR